MLVSDCHCVLVQPHLPVHELFHLVEVLHAPGFAVVQAAGCGGWVLVLQGRRWQHPGSGSEPVVDGIVAVAAAAVVGQNVPDGDLALVGHVGAGGR